MPDPFPFHPGELEVQARAGIPPRMVPIRDFMPDQHRTFFAQLPHLFVATVDDGDWPMLAVLSGAPGFVRSPDPTTLRIDTRLDPADPVTPWLTAGRPIGALGLEFETRRRNRANGVIAAADRGGLTVTVRQSFGNCPKYIHTRRPVASTTEPGPLERFDGLDPQARNTVLRADTFFVASSADAGQGPPGGVDVSHRGGAAGFVTVEGDTLTVPDYPGNRYFNTLGNFAVNPRGALLFVDFASGDLLHLQGLLEIDWSHDHAPGAERSWRFRTIRGWRLRAALPLLWPLDQAAATPGIAGAGAGRSSP